MSDGWIEPADLRAKLSLQMSKPHLCSLAQPVTSKFASAVEFGEKSTMERRKIPPPSPFCARWGKPRVRADTWGELHPFLYCRNDYTRNVLKCF